MPQAKSSRGFRNTNPFHGARTSYASWTPGGGGACTQGKVWVELCRRGLQTPTLFKTKIAHFASLFKTGDTTFWSWFFQSSHSLTGFQSKKTAPCSRRLIVKLYTLLKTQDPESHTLFCGTYPYRTNKRVPPSTRGSWRHSCLCLVTDQLLGRWKIQRKISQKDDYFFSRDFTFRIWLRKRYRMAPSPY